MAVVEQSAADNFSICEVSPGRSELPLALFVAYRPSSYRGHAVRWGMRPRGRHPSLKLELIVYLRRLTGKTVGGGDRDQWNERLLGQVARALPFKPENTEALSHAGSAVTARVVDMKPTDPISIPIVISRHIQNICRSLTKPECPFYSGPFSTG